MCALNNNQISAPNLIICVHKNVRPRTNHTCANVMRDTNCWMIRKPVLKTMIQRTEASMFFVIWFTILDSSVKNRFFIKHFRECPLGYTKNEQTGECDDIDECEGTDVTCNMDTQVCYNTKGSYKCLDIKPATEVNACPSGYKFESKIKQCVGMELMTDER